MPGALDPAFRSWETMTLYRPCSIELDRPLATEPRAVPLRILRAVPGEPAMSSQPYPNPQAIFYQHYAAVRRDEVVGILLALFLGSFGLHHFYLRRPGLGILYCCFFWTGIPGILGFIERSEEHTS